MKKEKLLLLGDNLRSVVAVSETLFKNGFEIHVLGWWGIPLNKSKWIAEYHCIPRWDLEIKKGKARFIEILKKNDYKAIIPVNDDALEIGAMFKELILEYTEMIGFPEKDKWVFARDKSVLLQRFEYLGLGGPQSILIDSVGALKSEEVPFSFPLIIKPCSSRQLGENEIKNVSVKKINNLSDWNLWKETASIFPVMIQEFIGGKELGFNFYAENGKIIHYYIDEQLHGLVGNEASYRRIAPLNETQCLQIKSVFQMFIDSIEWDGIGMFDFKYYNEKVYIIEFNGRFWASIQLSKLTGTDLVQVFVDRKLLNQPVDQAALKLSTKGSLRNMKSDMIFALKLLKSRNFKAFFNWFFSLKNMFSKHEYIEDSFIRNINFRIHILKWHLLNFVRR